MKKLIAIMGKSASGKDTIVKEIINRVNDIHLIISCTTRPRRENEINNIHYHFLTNEEMKEKILNEELYEYTVFNDWIYGTLKKDLKEDISNIGVFNPEGIGYLLDDQDLDVTVYYITASDKNRLLRQLCREDNPNIEEIIRRYGTDNKDFSSWNLENIPFIELHNDNDNEFEGCIRYIIENEGLE